MTSIVRTLARVPALLVVAASAAGAQDVFLGRLQNAGGLWTVDSLTNVTNRPGYDNQPSFTKDGKGLWYTSTREDAQADIYRYDLATRSITRLTTTAPESEYSAAATPDGERFTVIRVEKDSAQRLWSFKNDGTDPQVVIAGIKPVGYHVWADMVRLGLFVLGDPKVRGSPSTLQVYDTRTEEVDTLATGIGRSLSPMGPMGYFSFVKKDSAAGNFILYSVQTTVKRGEKPAVTRLVELPKGAEYVVWLARDEALTATGTKLYTWKRGGAWREIADLPGIQGASRLAVSPDKKWVAIVAEPAK